MQSGVGCFIRGQSNLLKPIQIVQNRENNMTSDASLRRTAILVASLFLVTAIGAIAGATLINPIINASDYLNTVFPKSAIVTIGMLFWLVNDIGIVFIGLLMFPILRKQSESLALGYVSMRIFESMLMIVGVIFAMLLIPLSQEFIKTGATDAASFRATGALLKQGESWLLNTMQLLFLSLGGIILTSMLYRAKLVPRFISVIGLIGYALLLPAFLIALFGLLDPTPGGPGTILAMPAAFFEIILMPVWLYAKGFNTGDLSAKQGASSGKMVIEPTCT
jgi:hypothetical protein